MSAPCSQQFACPRLVLHQRDAPASSSPIGMFTGSIGTRKATLVHERAATALANLKKCWLVLGKTQVHPNVGFYQIV